MTSRAKSRSLQECSDSALPNSVRRADHRSRVLHVCNTSSRAPARYRRPASPAASASGPAPIDSTNRWRQTCCGCLNARSSNPSRLSREERPCMRAQSTPIGSPDRARCTWCDVRRFVAVESESLVNDGLAPEIPIESRPTSRGSRTTTAVTSGSRP